MLLSTEETTIQPADTLIDRLTRRKWRVICVNRHYPDAWTIERGFIQRIIFPIDLSQYSVFLNNQK